LDNKKVAIIDLDSVIFSAFHPNKVLDNKGVPLRTEDNKRFIYKDKTPIEVVESCDFLMNSILTKSGATDYIAYVKGVNTTKRKEAVNPDYKADRGGIPPKYWKFTKEYLKLNWGAIEANNIETDDAVNITRLKVPDSFICAIDSDLLSLDGTHYNWRKDEWITNTKLQSAYKFWVDMITGTHNNTKGLIGKGEKFANKVLNETISIADEIVDRSYVQTFYQIVLEEYVIHFGEYIGIKEFYKNYVSLKLLEDYEGFVVPDLINFSKKNEW
jgi:hypothetical protein